MKLILMRHADAEPGDAVHYPDDALRPLTAEGIKTQRQVAQALKRMGILPERIYTSPRLRARQTAEITAQVLGLGHVLEERHVLGGGSSVNDMLALLRDSGDGTTLLCIGHEPDLCSLASALLCSACGLRIKLVTSGALVISFRGEVRVGQGVMRCLYRPQDLIALLQGIKRRGQPSGCPRQAKRGR